MKRFVIIPAGGLGTRMGLPHPKQLLPYGDRTVIEHAVDLFRGEDIWVPVPGAWEAAFREKIGDRVHLVIGGETRFDSVRNAFDALPDPADDDLVLIHDAARPFLDPAGLPAAWAAAENKGAIIYAAAAVDTMKQVGADGRIEATLDRRTLYHAQTPQIFRAGLLRRAYTESGRDPEDAPTDEARLLELAGIPVFVFPSSPANRKLTLKEDLELLNNRTTRIGHGYDVHRFDEARPLYLGGVLIPDGPGLAGHSDADVAIHALIDALLGAAGLGDIGRHFPDTDPAFAGIRSTELLARVRADLSRRNYGFGNADITIAAQIPRLAPHIDAMRECLAGVLQTTPDRINIKATTTERLGFVGRKEGMAAHAVAMLEVSR
ncbi:MAG: 2-C-methyl-D-erythritol 2,4-cyclodiphosphate synthase [Acidobacteriota bacterium]|nr:2-C-methyl-D-erythritol 2,4-cyclodiphosphate synthase [Acidobacteriota bacterium]